MAFHSHYPHCKVGKAVLNAHSWTAGAVFCRASASSPKGDPWGRKERVLENAGQQMKIGQLRMESANNPYIRPSCFAYVESNLRSRSRN
jgi:hypothetical protein